MNSADRREAALALERSAHLGVFTLAMAAEAGFTRSAVRHRLSTGAWRHVAGKAYVDVASRYLSDELRRRAVVAALTWPDSVLCLRSAALLHGMPVADDGLTHVIVDGRRRSLAGLVPHYLELRGNEVRRVLTFSATTPARTAADCLALLPAAEAEDLMAWVRTREIMTVADLDRAVEDRARRPGVDQLRRLVAATRKGALSGGERRLHRILDDAGITGWVADEPILVGARIIARADVLFVAARLIVEVDGRRAHTDFEKDRTRLNALTLAGYTVLRFTWRQLVDRPWSVRGQIETALRAAGSRSVRV